VIRNCSLLFAFVVCFAACSSTGEVEPSGPIARYGSTPIVDGVFDSGEWDDAEVVQTGTVEQFRIKHDGTYVYFAVRASGGDLVFNTDAGVRVLHWSAQLGSAEYVKTDSLMQTLDKPYAYELWGLQDESPEVIRETLAAYLAENGWVATTSKRSLMQTEFAISFDWLRVDSGSGPIVELPSIRVRGGLMMSREDPRFEELAALSPEELQRMYPSVSWPVGPAPSDSIGMGGGLPDTIYIDAADYGRVWIDLRR